MEEIVPASSDIEGNTNISNNLSSKETTIDSSLKNPSEDWKPGRQEWLIIVTLVVIATMAALDTTILVTVLPTLASRLQGTATDAFWVGTAFLLASAVVQPFLATLSDIFGRRELLLLSLLFFTVGTIVCCAAKNFTELLAGRAVQGIGGGGIVVLTLVVMTDIVPLRQRPKYNGLIQLAYSFGTITGPIIGGLIAQHTTWRWIFYINFPFCGCGLVMVPLVVNLKIERTSLKEKFIQTDWFGGFIFTASMISFLIAITWGGIQFAWSSHQTIVPLVLGVVGVLLALAWEVWGTKTPFLRVFLFNSRSAVLAYACAVLQGFLLFSAIYYLPFYFEAVKGFSPTTASIALLPLSVTLLPSSVIFGLIMTKSGKFQLTLWSGWMILVLSNGLLILLDDDTSTVTWIFILLVLGIGHGAIFMPLIFGTQAMAKTGDVAYAATMYAFLRALGYTIGVAVGGTAFQNTLSQNLADAGLPASIAKDAESYVAVLNAMPKDSSMYHQLIQAYTSSFRTVWEIMTAISGLGLVFSLGIAHYSLDREHDSRHKLNRGDRIERL